MNRNTTFYLSALVILSAYVIQRSLLFITEEFKMENKLNQPQVDENIIGVDLPFSYLGMNIYWPFVISITLIAYNHSRRSNEKYIKSIFDKTPLISESLLSIYVPAIALALHYWSISLFFINHLDVAISPITAYSNPELIIPDVNYIMSSAVICLLVIFSIILSTNTIYFVKKQKPT